MTPDLIISAAFRVKQLWTERLFCRRAMILPAVRSTLFSGAIHFIGSPCSIRPHIQKLRVSMGSRTQGLFIPDNNCAFHNPFMKTPLRSQAWMSQIQRVGLTVGLVLGTACAPSVPVIRIEDSSLQINHTGQASVTVERITNLTAFEVHLSFDAHILEVVELQNGKFIKPDFILENSFDNGAGTIDYAVAQINDPPAKGSGTLFTLILRAKAEGRSPLYFRETQAAPAGALFSNSDGMAIQVSLMDGSVNVADSVNMLPALISSLFLRVFPEQDRLGSGD